ncbi:MAG: hypothetical protein ACKVPX_15235 [Myxococcaceae bacterium]
MRRRLSLPMLVCSLGLLVGVWGTDADAAPKRGARVTKRRPEPRVRIKKEAPPKSAESDLVPVAASSAPPPSRGPTRIDFDDRLVQGQTNKSGSIYLYDRKELKTRSMVKMRDSFREEIVGSVYDR